MEQVKRQTLRNTTYSRYTYIYLHLCTLMQLKSIFGHIMPESHNKILSMQYKCSVNINNAYSVSFT